MSKVTELTAILSAGHEPMFLTPRVRPLVTMAHTDAIGWSPKAQCLVLALPLNYTQPQNARDSLIQSVNKKAKAQRRAQFKARVSGTEPANSEPWGNVLTSLG